MKNLVEYLIKNIVNKPDEVIIEEVVMESSDGRSSIIYNINANPEDIGIIIGKNGRTIKALRSIVKVKAIREKKFVDLKVPDKIQDIDITL